MRHRLTDHEEAERESEREREREREREIWEVRVGRPPILCELSREPKNLA